ncbi:unnamed protein product [Closterium sp. Naga37s-1]|nr:unnamed protein product [Closterium sp. Naga37s-1]
MHAAVHGNTSLRQDLGMEMKDLLHECSRVVMMLAASMEKFIWEGRPPLVLLHSQNDFLKEKALHSLQQLVHPKSAAEVEIYSPHALILAGNICCRPVNRTAPFRR